MKTVSLDRGANQKLLWVLAAVAFGIMGATANQNDVGILAVAVLVAVASLIPFGCWVQGLSHGLPLWPVFALVTGLTAAFPMVQAPVVLQDYSGGEVMVGGLTVAAFIGVGTIVWLSFSGGKTVPPRQVLMITREHSERYLFVFVAVGLLFQMNQLFWWFELPGNSMQVVRGVSMALNTMGIFVLAFYQGRGLLTAKANVLLIVLTAGTALVAAAGLVLAQAMVPVAMYLLGNTLGKGAVPWKALAVVVGILAVLHPGKYVMRDLYWGEERPTFQLSTLPQFYWDWVNYGLVEMGIVRGAGPAVQEEESASSVFERAGNLHMLLLVQRKSPEEVPYLNGLTYEHIPRMLIPRFIYSGKGISHAGNVLLTVNYGLQTLDQTKTTSIGWGLVPEAYANFGYLGVVFLAVLLGGFYGMVTRITVGVPMTSLRFVLGLLVLAAATKADTMGIFISSQFQGVVGVSLAALLLMKRQPNPLAGDTPTEEREGDLRQILARLANESASKLSKKLPIGRQALGMRGKQMQSLPKWMPRSHRRAFALAVARQEAENPKVAEEKSSTKPRQVAVPIQPYYYRSRKA